MVHSVMTMSSCSVCESFESLGQVSCSAYCMASTSENSVS